MTSLQQNPLCVVVVDDHPVVRRGLIDLINDEPDLTVCGEADSIASAMATINSTEPDVAIVDLSLGSESGLDLVASVNAHFPDVRIVVLSAHDELLFAERALKAGAHGYIMKSETAENQLAAIRRVASGRHYVSDQMSERMLASVGNRSHPEGHSPVDRLTERELTVFRLVGQGLETRQIAEHLSLSVKTIESHYAHIKEKLGAKTARELVRFAVNWSNNALY
jgi:DNA-binding NarL/FixJ family response regulator